MSIDNTNNENDELNYFCEANKSIIENVNKFGEEDGKDSIQYNFEIIVNKNQLILPIFLLFYVKKPVENQIVDFNKYILSHYSKSPQLVNLFEQLNFLFKIPNEVLSKFWVRAYTSESNFYKDMNKDLRLNKVNKYLPFIHMMYEGVKIKSLTFKYKNKLYRGTYFDEKEILLLEASLKIKKPNLPGSIVYSKIFLSFSNDLKIAMKFKKNVLLVIEEFKEDCSIYPASAEIKKYSFFKKEEEILIFPFSCFEIKEIKKKTEEKDESKIYYEISLRYLGKYEKLFKGEDPIDLIENIPQDSFLAQQVFKTGIIDEKFNNIFYKKNRKNIGPDNNMIYDMIKNKIFFDNIKLISFNDNEENLKEKEIKNKNNNKNNKKNNSELEYINTC